MRGCKDVVRNDMLKEEACVRLQGRLARGHAETWQACAGQGRNDMLKEEACVRVQGRLARGHAETWQVCAGQGRNDMQRAGRRAAGEQGRGGRQKAGALLRVQGRFPAVHRRCPPANADTGQIFACHCKPVMGLSGLSRLSNEKNPGKSPAREKHTLTFSRKIDKITTYREAVRLRGFPAGSGPSPIAPPAATPDNKIRRNSL